MRFFDKVKNFFTGKETEIVASTGTKPVDVIRREYHEDLKKRQDKLNKRLKERQDKLEANKTPKSKNSPKFPEVPTHKMGEEPNYLPNFPKAPTHNVIIGKKPQLKNERRPTQAELNVMKMQATLAEEKLKRDLDKAHNVSNSGYLSPQIKESLDSSINRHDTKGRGRGL